MKKKNWLLVMMIISMVVLLVACDSTEQAVTSESSGFWNQIFVYPLSWFLTTVANVSFLNYGWAIVIVTIIVRFALLPLMVKQMKSTKAMQELQPELNQLKEKYSSKDQATQAQLQKETMELFKTNGVNPVAGCLPLLIQMPVLIAFYQAIMRTPPIKTDVFLWFTLGTADPYYILPILAAVTTFFQQKITMIGQVQTGAVAQQMKMMTYMMPVMILVMGITLPSALSLYWTVGNTFMMIQTFIMKYPEIQAEREKKAGSSTK